MAAAGTVRPAPCRETSAGGYKLRRCAESLRISQAEHGDLTHGRTEPAGPADQPLGSLDRDFSSARWRLDYNYDSGGDPRTGERHGKRRQVNIQHRHDALTAPGNGVFLGSSVF